MALNSNSQVSYFVLDSLSDGAKYGLEIIEFISQKTGGNYILKKPTLYSCLTRMEKKGLISSSFWEDSELGGKRHYYNITNAGRRALEELALQNDEFSFAQQETVQTSFVSSEPADEKPVFLQQDNLFNLASKQEEKTETTVEETSNVIENQIDIFSMEPLDTQPEEVQPAEEPAEEIQQTEEHKERMEYYQSILEQSPATKLSYEEEIQNRRLYDTSSELKKYRKKKSFSENQIEMAVVYENEEDQQLQRARIEELKASMLNARQIQAQTLQREGVQEATEQKDVEFKREEIKPSEEPERVDDAVLITEPRINADEVPIQRRITPPNIEIDISDSNLPAPRRNTELEPTYKDMMSKLFERKKEKKVETKIEPTETKHVMEYESEPMQTSFVDYSTLKSYYRGHGIEFKEYHRTNVTRNHNTNFLLFICSVAMFLLSAIGCTILFGIISAAGKLSASSNFLFYTVPLLFLVYTIFALIRFKWLPNQKAALRYNALVNWIVCILATIIILIVNIIAGMQAETMGSFVTSLVVPIYAVIIVFPINFYMMKFLYTKYAR